MKLKSVLRSLDMEALREILRFWGLTATANAEAGAEEEIDPSATHEQWVEYLYPRLQNASHFRTAVQKLEKVHRDLLSFLAIHGGNMEEKELRKRFFTGNRTGMKEVVDMMARHALLFEERWNELPGKPRVYGIPEPFLRLIELPHFWRWHLGTLLRQIPLEQLHRIATQGLGLKTLSSKRDHLMHEIRAILTDPDQLRAYIDRLPDGQREMLFLLLQRRGVCLYRDLLDMAHSRLPEINRSDAIEGLLNMSGLLFQETDNPSKLDNLLRVPRDLYYIITHHFVRDLRGLDDLDTISQVTPQRQPKSILDSGTALLRDIVIFVGYVKRHSVRQLGNGGIGRNDLKKILARLSSNKTLKYVQFLAYYCIARKFLVPEGTVGNENWGVSSSFRERLADSRAFFLDVYSHWLETNDWNEEFIDGDCVHSDHPPTGLINIVELRRLVLENLANIPFDTWIDGPRFIESLLAQIEVRIPHRGGKGRLDKFNRINYLVIESMLCENLYWMGLVSLGLHEATLFEELGNRFQTSPEQNSKAAKDRPAQRFDQHFNYNPRPYLPDSYHFHFQISSLGRSLLATKYTRSVRSLLVSDDVALPFRDDMFHFTVLPNLDVVAPPDLNLQRFATLCQFSEVRHIDVMSTLAITHDTVRAGMEHGLKGDEILSFLQQGCPSGLPETVRHLINECSNRYGELVVGYAGGYIQVDDPVLQENLRNNKALVPWLKDVKGDRLLLLNRSADVQHVAQELKALGFMPSVDSQNVYVTAEARLRFALTPNDLAILMGILHFVRSVEEELGEDLTEGKCLPLLNMLRPSTHGQINIDHSTDVLAKRFEKAFENAMKKKINAVANKYRRQMRDFLSQKAPAKAVSTTTLVNPATTEDDVRKLLLAAIEAETRVEILYKRPTGEEANETVLPESLNGDKLYAFSDQIQSYCAYRTRRIVTARIP